MNVDIYILLDESGSMQGYEAETISAFKEYLEDRRLSTTDPTFVSVATFDSTHFRWIYQWQPLETARDMTLEDYHPNAMTPLNDAVGRVIDVAETNPDTGKLVIVISDGMENHSTKYPGVGNEELKARIAALDKHQWGFVYIGERMDAYAAGAVGASVGVSAKNMAGVQNMSHGMMMAAAASDAYYANVHAGEYVVQDSLLEDVQNLNETDLKARLMKKHGHKLSKSK